MKKVLLIIVSMLLFPICAMGMDAGCGQTTEMPSDADLSATVERMARNYNLLMDKLADTLSIIETCDDPVKIGAANDTAAQDLLEMQRELQNQLLMIDALSNLSKKESQAAMQAAKKIPQW